MREQFLAIMACRKTTWGLLTCSSRAVLLMLNRESQTGHISNVFPIRPPAVPAQSPRHYTARAGPNLLVYDPDEHTLVIADGKTGYTLLKSICEL